MHERERIVIGVITNSEEHLYEILLKFPILKYIYIASYYEIDYENK